jgi:pilus assembly protein CpaB
MEPKKIALLVGALVVAAMAAVMAKNMFGQSAAPQAQATVVAAPVGPEVLVATRMLPVGTIIQPDSFRYQPWPKDLVENAYYIKGSADPASLAGTVVRADITAGQPLTQGSLVKPGDRGFLAAALGAGMRAVTVAVSNQTGVAGFVFPGDRVDLVLTQSVAGQGPELKASETFIRNVRVLATDQKVVPDEDDKGNKKVAVAQSVTLEVTPRLAEKIAVAQTIGQLSLSLRSIADNNAELDRAIASGDVTLPQGADAKTTAAIMEQAAARPQDSNTTYVTGADVSRFQRRTVPPSNNSSNAIAPMNAGQAGSAMGTMVSAMIAKALPQGPVVKVARGNNVTEVQLGSK